MISSEHEEILRELNFVSHHETHSFDTLLTSIDVIAYEENLSVFTWPSCDFKKTKEIEKLSVSVTHNFDWSCDFNEHVIVCKSRGTFINDEFDSLRIKIDRRAPFRILN